VALLEAMAAGLPAIAGDVGGVGEALGPREGRHAAGWIVPPGRPPALAAALRALAAGIRVGSPGVAARVREAAYRMEHWFTVDAMMEGIEAALRGDPPPPARG
jgi:glycosyltransferase involved in cell wall biosynthesis